MSFLSLLFPQGGEYCLHSLNPFVPEDRGVAGDLPVFVDKPYIGVAHVPFVIKLVEKKQVWNGFVALVAEALEDRLKHVPVAMEKGGLTNELSYTLTLVGVLFLLNTLQ